MNYFINFLIGLLSILVFSCSQNKVSNAIVKVERYNEYDSLFLSETGWEKSTSKWFGGDAAFSIPLNRYDNRTVPDSTIKTLWVFADTSVGESKDTTKLITFNSAAIMRGNDVKKATIEYIVGNNGNGEIQEWGDSSSLIIANTPMALANSNKLPRLWPNDGVVIGDTLFLFARLIINDDINPWGFLRKGTVLIKIPIEDGLPNFNKQKQLDHHLFISDNGEHMNAPYGCAILDNTYEGGAPFPDGFIYVYGVSWFRKDGNFKMFVSRVEPDNFTDVKSWTYYSEEKWNGNIENSTIIAEGVNCENTVLPLSNGKFLLIAQQDNSIYYNIGDNPWGPFNVKDRKVFFTIPEHKIKTEYGAIDTYNAKAHPHLSTEDFLLVSYNVNHFPFYPYLNTHIDYRPRFIKLPWKLIGL